MRLIQFVHEGSTCVGRVDGSSIALLDIAGGVLALAQRAAADNLRIAQIVDSLVTPIRLDYDTLEAQCCLLPPVTHSDPAHTRVSITGLTHLGSAESRSAMHASLSTNSALTDTMKMFKAGVEGGKPTPGNIGFQAEWCYKGDGSIIVAPGGPIPVPGFAGSANEEPEIVGVYLIDGDGTPMRIGFALGNEFSDHATERFNYLWLAHSKMRPCAFGPELLLDELPPSLSGTSRILRKGQVVWERSFLTGEDNMCHSIENLEHHHFKHPQFRQPGDLHLYYFGTATVSSADGFELLDGDTMEIEQTMFGRPLRNSLSFQPAEGLKKVRIL